MKKISVKLYYMYKKLSRNYEGLGHLISSVKCFFQEPRLKAIFNLIFATIISFEMKLSNFDNFAWNDIATYKNIIHIILTIIIYCLFLFLSTAIDLITKDRNKKHSYYKEIINRQTVINNTIGDKLLEAYNNINQKVSYIPTKTDINTYKYQDIACLICLSVYNIIKASTGEEAHQVSIMHKFNSKKKGNTYIKMIAFSNLSTNTPVSFNTQYPLNNKEANQNRKYYHQRIFENNINGIKVLCSRAEIEKEFIENPKGKERDQKIQQYVAMPIYCKEAGIISLLQIDTDVKNLFGYNKEQVIDFFKAIIPFTQQLLVNFNREQLVNSLHKKVDIYAKRTNNSKNKASENVKEKNKEG